MKPFVLATLIGLALTGAAVAAPSLRSDITVTGDVVTIGDMFDNAGELADAAIFRAPAPGTTGVVPLAVVTNAAQLAGLNDFDAAGLTSVRVVRASTTIDATALDALITAKLTQQGALTPGVTADVQFDQPDVTFAAAAVANPATLSVLRYSQGAPAFAARFVIAGIDEPIDLTGTITLMTAVPRLLNNLTAGTILDPSDFDSITVPLSMAQGGGFADLDQLVGKQLLRQSHSGVVLKPEDVGEPTVVLRSAMVTALLKVGPMTLTVKVQAMANASAGQPVEVMNTLTKKILHGTAQSDGTVTIDATNASS
jgi:flagella basal body P-ring formation protein FlgA